MGGFRSIWAFIALAFTRIRDLLARWPWGVTAALVILAVVGAVHLVQVFSRW